MKKKLSTIILLLIFIVGLLVMLYPTISDWWNQRTQSKVIDKYEETIANMHEDDFKKLFDDANEYNRKLRKLQEPLVQFGRVSGYYSALNVSGNSVIGYISIQKLGVELPIYHGTDDSVLQVAAGHLQGSSLPIGGKGTHTVISAHRGLPRAKLFTDLDKMEVGDIFTFKILNRTITYQVDQILTVLPSELSSLRIDPKHDYATLVTCTPYGINTHRLMVRGKRIKNMLTSQVHVATDAYIIDSLILAPLVAIPLLIILLLILIVRYRIRKKHDKVQMIEETINRTSKQNDETE